MLFLLTINCGSLVVEAVLQFPREDCSVFLEFSVLFLLITI